jgi:hypothetical protein
MDTLLDHSDFDSPLKKHIDDDRVQFEELDLYFTKMAEISVQKNRLRESNNFWLRYELFNEWSENESSFH